MNIKKTLAIGACAAAFGSLAGCMVVPANGYSNGPVYRSYGPGYGYVPPPPVYVPPPLIVVPQLYPFGWRHHHHHHGYGRRW